MKFGKLLRATVESRLPQWQDKMLHYKQLKQAIKQLVYQRTAMGLSQQQASSSFTALLDVEVEKVNDFYSDRIEEAVIIQHALRHHVEQMIQHGSTLEQRTACQRSLVSIHFNLLMLQNYVALNFTGIVKALKKFDKQLGAELRPDYIGAIVELPFYRCQALGQLVEETEKTFRLLEGSATCTAGALAKAGCGSPLLPAFQHADDRSCA